MRLTLAAALLGLLGAYGLHFVNVTEGFATPQQVVVVSLVAGGAGYLLLTRRRIVFAACVLLPNLWSHGLVNPVAVGLGPILDTSVVRAVAPVVRQDPDARWAVFGDYSWADLVKVTGADVINGTRFVPSFDDLQLIDPDGPNAEIYNRYAHVSLVPRAGTEIDFVLRHGDSYRIQIDPLHDVWRRLGVDYFVFPFQVKNPDFLANATPVLALRKAKLWIYRYHWGVEQTSD
jgi:hypothetical protein